jgi:hypothetical protein
MQTISSQPSGYPDPRGFLCQGPIPPTTKPPGAPIPDPRPKPEPPTEPAKRDDEKEGRSRAS